MDIQLTDSRRLLWSDVLHYKWLAERASDPWDYSTYTRSILITGWSVVELCTAKWSGCHDVGFSYKKKLKEHTKKVGGKPIDWSAGWAREASDLLTERKKVIHCGQITAPDDLLIKKGQHQKLFLKLKAVLCELRDHYESSEDAWWEDSQWEDYKAEKCCIAGRTVSIHFDELTGHTVGYVRHGCDVIYAQVPPEESRERYEQMQRDLRGPVQGTFIKQGDTDIVREPFISRGC